MVQIRPNVTQTWRRGSQRGVFFCLCILVACSLSLPELDYAQVGLPPVIDPSGRSGLPPPVEQKKPLRPEQPPSDILPPVQPSPRDLREKGPLLRVFVRQIQVVGSTVL